MSLCKARTDVEINPPLPFAGSSPTVRELKVIRAAFLCLHFCHHFASGIRSFKYKAGFPVSILFPSPRCSHVRGLAFVVKVLKAPRRTDKRGFHLCFGEGLDAVAMILSTTFSSFIGSFTSHTLRSRRSYMDPTKPIQKQLFLLVLFCPAPRAPASLQ